MFIILVKKNYYVGVGVEIHKLSSFWYRIQIRYFYWFCQINSTFQIKVKNRETGNFKNSKFAL